MNESIAGFEIPGVGGVTLALDRAKTAIVFFCDKINAYIATVEFCSGCCPLFIEVDLGKLFFVVGVLGEIFLHQPLELITFLAFRSGVLADVIEDALEAEIDFCAVTIES